MIVAILEGPAAGTDIGLNVTDTTDSELNGTDVVAVPVLSTGEWTAGGANVHQPCHGDGPAGRGPDPN